MDYVVNKTEQIGVTADSPQEAIQKVMGNEGVVIAANYSASPRPQSAVMTQPPTPGTPQQIAMAAVAAKMAGSVPAKK